MKSKLLPVILIVALVAIIGFTAVGCTGGGSHGWAGPALSQGVIYLGTQDGKVIALDAQNSHQTKSPYDDFDTGSSGGFGCSSASNAVFYSTAAVSSDMVYISDYDGDVYAFTSNLVPGWDKKRFEAKSRIIGNLVLADGTLYFGASNKKVYALDASTGKLKWTFKTKGKLWSTPTIADGIIYIGSLDHHVYAIKADTGEGVPGFNFKAQGAVVTAPIVQGDTIYVGANDRYLYAINKADGSLKWKFKGTSWFWSQPAVSGDTIYGVTLNGKLYAVKDMGSTYELLWQEDMKAKVTAPLLMAKVNGQEMLFVGDHDKYLTALNTGEDLPTGKQRIEWVKKFKAPIYAAMTYSEDNSYIYVYTRNDELRALDAATNATKWAYDTNDMVSISDR